MLDLWLHTVWLKLANLHRLYSTLINAMEVVTVPSRLEISAESLRLYLEQELPGFRCSNGQLVVRKFK